MHNLDPVHTGGAIVASVEMALTSAATLWTDGSRRRDCCVDHKSRHREQHKRQTRCALYNKSTTNRSNGVWALTNSMNSDCVVAVVLTVKTAVSEREMNQSPVGL